MIAILFCLLLAFENSTTMQHIDFSVEQIHLQTADGYTMVRMDGCELTNLIGASELPVRALSMALPFGAMDCQVQIIATETETLDGSYLVRCAQPPVILSQNEMMLQDVW